ncbi:hypothetical protein GGX14DRAFT_538368 [Mycena pura]|uniref:Uncharacterized protein n=1 Tax=Mycena pura TaxID=153505 RepID=A0AAD6YV07_9AGAR|nr:hypothetical protein GGX14DRAFT_538368 [Mycena pura]
MPNLNPEPRLGSVLALLGKRVRAELHLKSAKKADVKALDNLHEPRWIRAHFWITVRKGGGPVTRTSLALTTARMEARMKTIMDVTLPHSTTMIHAAILPRHLVTPSRLAIWSSDIASQLSGDPFYRSMVR